MLGVCVYRLVWIALWVFRHVWWNWTLSAHTMTQ